MTSPVKDNIAQIGTLVSELVALYMVPANIEDFEQSETALAVALSKLQFFSSALLIARQGRELAAGMRTRRSIQQRETRR